MQRNYDDGHLHRTSPFAWAVLGLVLVAVVFAAVALFAHAYVNPTMMPYYGGGWWFFFPFGFIFFFIFIFFIGRLLFWPWGWRRGYYWNYGGDAKEILRRRYARGELSKDQFDQMMRDLDQH